jgi:Tat protein secretion system quality control protein TatD with DNase activity
VKYVAEAAAALKEMPVEELAAITSTNAKRIFGLK